MISKQLEFICTINPDSKDSQDFKSQHYCIFKSIFSQCLIICLENLSFRDFKGHPTRLPYSVSYEMAWDPLTRIWRVWHLIAKQTDTMHIRHTMANLTHCGESSYHKYLNQVMKNFNFRLISDWWKRYVVDFLRLKLFKC